MCCLLGGQSRRSPACRGRYSNKKGSDGDGGGSKVRIYIYIYLESICIDRERERGEQKVTGLTLYCTLFKDSI